LRFLRLTFCRQVFFRSLFLLMERSPPASFFFPPPFHSSQLPRSPLMRSLFRSFSRCPTVCPSLYVIQFLPRFPTGGLRYRTHLWASFPPSPSTVCLDPPFAGPFFPCMDHHLYPPQTVPQIHHSPSLVRPSSCSGGLAQVTPTHLTQGPIPPRVIGFCFVVLVEFSPFSFPVPFFSGHSLASLSLLGRYLSVFFFLSSEEHLPPCSGVLSAFFFLSSILSTVEVFLS